MAFGKRVPICEGVSGGYVSSGGACGDGLLAITQSSSLSGFAGYFGKYVTVFLAGKNMNLFIELKRGAKFVDTKVVR